MPTEHTIGPWRSDAQHGGPPAALLARSIEEHIDPDQFLARISVELIKPVPLDSLRVSTETVTPSRRVTHVNATLTANEAHVATATAVVLRGAELPPPSWVGNDEPLIVPGAEQTTTPEPFMASDSEVLFHVDAIEHRMESGSFGEPGPAVDWARLTEPLLPDEPTSGHCAVLALADCGSGISAVYDFGSGAGLINVDLTVAFSRTPAGDWFKLEAVTHVSELGTGLAITRVSDQVGPVAIATQTLLEMALTR